MPAGYDKRTEYSSRFEAKTWDNSGLLVKATHGRKSKAEVTSYRNDVQGTPLAAKDVDTYSGYFSRNAGLASYLNPGPRLQAELEASGLTDDGGFENEANFLDNGHPFTLKRSTVETSHLGRAYFRHSSSTTGPARSASMFAVSSIGIASPGVPKLLWNLDSGSSSGTRRWNVSSEIPLPAVDQLPSDATKMLGLCSPGKPPVDLVATVGELFAGVPLLPGHTLLREGILPGLGSEYLNMVFGLIPTYGDAVDVADALKTVSTRLLQLRRDCGRPVRRKMAFPLTQKSEILSGADLQPATSNTRVWSCTDINHGFNSVTDYGTPGSDSLNSVYTGAAIPTLFMRESRKVWFSGSFTYQIPTMPNLPGKLETWLTEYDRLLGLSLNSQNAWQLAPWSWLVDWFLDIRQNLDAIAVAHDDNLVVNYGYGMEHIYRTIVAKVQFTNGTSIYGNPYVRTEQVSESKRRIRANPYGFVKEADSSQWSSYRLAVLGALGLTRIFN